MADVEFFDYSVKVKGAIDDKINAVLEECAAEVESQTKRNSRVDTGQTKNSWKHVVTQNQNYGGDHVAVIGSNNQNAIWEEFGTGEYALKGNGRKGGWVYKSDKDGKFYQTHGKKPSRAFWKAYSSLKNKIISRIQSSLKGL